MQTLRVTHVRSGGGGGGGGGAAPPPPASPSPSLLSLRQRCDLSTRRLRGPHLASLAALEAASAASRPALLEAAAARRRMADARAEAGAGGAGAAAAAAAASSGHSRAWFVPPEAWIAGTAAVASSGAPSFFFEVAGKGAGGAANGGKKGENGKGGRKHKTAASSNPGELPTAPADEAQRSCALTGEPFDSFFDESTGEWRYRDCMALDAAGAAAAGLPARRCLVKASALLMGGDGDDRSEDEDERDEDDEEAEKETESGGLGHQLSSVPLEQVEAALAEAAAAVGQEGMGEEGEEEEAATRVKEEAAA